MRTVLRDSCEACALNGRVAAADVKRFFHPRQAMHTMGFRAECCAGWTLPIVQNRSRELYGIRMPTLDHKYSKVLTFISCYSDCT